MHFPFAAHRPHSYYVHELPTPIAARIAIKCWGGKRSVQRTIINSQHRQDAVIFLARIRLWRHDRVL